MVYLSRFDIRGLIFFMYSLRRLGTVFMCLNEVWMKTCTFILLFIYSSHVSYIVCLLNSNVKCGLLENCSSSVTKLDISGLLTLHLYDLWLTTRTIKPPSHRVEFCNLYWSQPCKWSHVHWPITLHLRALYAVYGPVQPCGTVHFSVTGID